MALQHITFYKRFRDDILAKRKTITIRDASEKDFAVNSIVTVAEYETGSVFARVKINSVTPILLNELSDEHARQENMSLSELKQVIGEIYPKENSFYVIRFLLVE